MTETQKAAIRQALEALEYGQHSLKQISEHQWESRGQLAMDALRAALAEPAQEPKPIALPSEDKARQAFWDCYPDSGNADMRDVWMTCYRWCRAIVAVPQQQAEPVPEPVAERNREWHDGFLEGRLRERQYWLAGCCMNTAPPTRRPLTDEFLRKLHHEGQTLSSLCDYEEFERAACAAIAKAEGGNDE